MLYSDKHYFFARLDAKRPGARVLRDWSVRSPHAVRFPHTLTGLHQMPRAKGPYSPNPTPPQRASRPKPRFPYR